MAIVLIYHHEERRRADDWAKKLEKSGYSVVLAPLGFEVDSDPWKAKVMNDLKAADAVLVFWSQKSIIDESVIWRAQYARQNGVLVPVLLDRVRPPMGFRAIQAADLTDPGSADRAFLVLLQDLKLILKSPPPVVCFLSYSRNDREFAIRLASDLKQQKVAVWRDQDDILAGSSWDDEIQEALSNCTHVLLIATPNSITSSNVLDEVSFAREQQKPIIPLLLTDCHLPFRLRRLQWIDFRVDYSEGIAKLMHRLGARQNEL